MGYGVLRVLRNLGPALFLSAVAVQAETLTIAALGDSLTQGYGLPEADGLVPQLQAWLQAQGADVEVINAGVSGDTSAGGLARVNWTLTPEVDAMIVNLGGNDLLRGIDPVITRKNLESILQIAATEGIEVLLVGLEATGNFGPEYKAAFDAMYPELSAAYGTDLFPSFFDSLFGENLDVSRLAFMQSDGIHPNAAGVARIIEDLGPVVLALLARVN